MTTIATDGKTMAGDGQRSHRGSITNRTARKVRRLKDGSLVGTAGCVAFGDCVVEWLENGGEAPTPKGDEGFAALILKPSGEVYLVGQECKPSLIEVPFAVGSGMDVALGAMAFGASPLEAVQVAARYDADTGGEIMELALDSGAKLRAAG